MKNRYFFNFSSSIFLTVLFLFCFTFCAFFTVVSISYNKYLSTFGFGVSAIIILFAAMFVLSMSCWRYVVIDSDRITTGGLFRKKICLNFSEIIEISENYILVYNFTQNLLTRAYVFSSGSKKISVPCELINNDLLTSIKSDISNRKNI